MSDILQKIIERKKQEVIERQELFPIKLLEKSTFFSAPTISLKKYILREDKSGIIAEIKRKSPSKGDINPYVSIEKTSIGYMQAGASALSILTDKDFFGGKNEDLTTARKFNFCPILRKDFTIAEYQIIEARSIGADAILLIAAALNPKQASSLARFAKSLGLEVLLEVHDADELDKFINDDIDLVGVNNRSLKTFEVNIQSSFDLVDKIPNQFVKISESALSNPQTLVDLKKAGFNGFLMGEAFMKQSQPEKAAALFIQQLQLLESQALNAVSK